MFLAFWGQGASRGAGHVGDPAESLSGPMTSRMVQDTTARTCRAVPDNE
ncbi:hypothetical protein NOGI109294_07130 [Nocardiopsis gilva]